MEKVTVPYGEKGSWVIKPYEITEKEARFDGMRMAFQGEGRRAPEAGTFTILYHHGHCIMSDTRAEMIDHRYFVHRAKGRVLINGLGLGVVVHNLLLRDEVEHITIIEVDEDVISLVAEHYHKMGNSRVTIIHADALTYVPSKGIKFDAVWHDIWPNITSDNIPTMSTLHRRYGRRLTPDGFQDSWCRQQVKDIQRRDRAYIW